MKAFLAFYRCVGVEIISARNSTTDIMFEYRHSDPEQALFIPFTSRLKHQFQYPCDCVRVLFIDKLLCLEIRMRTYKNKHMERNFGTKSKFRDAFLELTHKNTFALFRHFLLHKYLSTQGEQNLLYCDVKYWVSKCTLL